MEVNIGGVRWVGYSWAALTYQPKSPSFGHSQYCSGGQLVIKEGVILALIERRVKEG